MADEAELVNFIEHGRGKLCVGAVFYDQDRLAGGNKRRHAADGFSDAQRRVADLRIPLAVEQILARKPVDDIEITGDAEKSVSVLRNDQEIRVLRVRVGGNSA